MTRPIPFRRIPHQSALFVDYVEAEPKALGYYERPPRLENIEEAARNEIRTLPFPRREICSILLRQNLELGNAAARAQIAELEKPDSIAIVTGQQVGLFTGPLYTLYKALTAIRVAEELRARGVRAVPLFWMDSEDHDLAEVAWFSLLRPRAGLEKIDARPLLFAGSGEDSSRSVGGITLPAGVEAVVDSLVASLEPGPQGDALRARIRAAYRPGATFSQAFARLLAVFLGGRGLVLFDPQDAHAKPLVAHLFQKALIEADAIRRTLVERNAALEAAGYHTQVHVLESSTVLFLHEEGERRPLVGENDGFALKGSAARHSSAELVELAGSAPERFSPNVLLRPIVQDTLFPTAAYVGGPAEVAYFAQVAAIYPLFGRPMPVIWPRASFTLLEPEARAELDAGGVELEDCFAGKHQVVEKLIRAANHSSATGTLKGLGDYLETELDALRPALVASDASLAGALETARRKIKHQVAALETKFVHFQTRHDQGLLERADFLLDRCYPNRNLQERQLGAAPFLARHGAPLVEQIYARVALDAFTHQILSLE